MREWFSGTPTRFCANIISGLMVFDPKLFGRLAESDRQKHPLSLSDSSKERRMVFSLKSEVFNHSANLNSFSKVAMWYATDIAGQVAQWVTDSSATIRSTSSNWSKYYSRHSRQIRISMTVGLGFCPELSVGGWLPVEVQRKANVSHSRCEVFHQGLRFTNQPTWVTCFQQFRVFDATEICSDSWLQPTNNKSVSCCHHCRSHVLGILYISDPVQKEEKMKISMCSVFFATTKCFVSLLFALHFKMFCFKQGDFPRSSAQLLRQISVQVSLQCDIIYIEATTSVNCTLQVLP